MNAFPPELLHHHFACMVVAGLTSPSKSPTPVTTASASSSSPLAAPSDSASDPAAPADHPTTVFPDLTKSLHDILASRARNTLWDPSRGRAAVFHTVFADHSVRLPPLKTKPSARHVSPIPSITTGSTTTPSESSTAAFAALPPRSPLSPLHPNSPQFPDGLIAPVWVRKHRELVPSVFVCFHCLPTSSHMQEARTADEALINTISERRRTLTERGIKLTIVLLTQRQMLDDAQLDARLSYIRRSSGLDSKASLFVLTPVTKPELGEFVSSLHSALFESAADYYREHARRVKRKRTRYPPPTSTLQPIITAIGTLPSAQPNSSRLSVADLSWLSRDGWVVRSEYKLGVFAELAADMHEALLRYRDAYHLLCNSAACLLGSTLMLPPRTKRWAEAKVLADTLSVRICKLLLYVDDAEAAAVFFRRHLARFTELSTGWGIGAITFEYWSWLSKQYRLFAELLEHATRAIPGAPLPPFQLPAHAPPLPSKLVHPHSLPRFSDGRGGVNPPPGMLLPNSNAVSVSILPHTTLQTPGTYYYLAALCTLERRQRFLRATSASNPADEANDSSPLSHERNVDHTAQLTEILTKAYDSFKRNRLHRAALFVAANIATAYCDGGQNHMAFKFLERILKSYKKDNVHHVRSGLVQVAVQAAIGASDRASAVRMLIEALDPTLPMADEKRDEVVHAVKTFLHQSQHEDAHQEKQNEKSDEQSKTNSATAVTAGFLDIQAVLLAAEVQVGAHIPYQLVLRNTSTYDLDDIFCIDRITFHLQTGDAEQTTVEITSTPSATNIDPTKPTKPTIITLDTIHPTTTLKPTSADLSSILAKQSLLALQGHVNASHEGTIRITNATIHARSGTDSTWQLEALLPDRDDALCEADGMKTVYWLMPTGRCVALAQRAEPTMTLVKPGRFNVSLCASAPSYGGYVDERVPLTIRVLNNEQRQVQVWVDAVLQPSYEGALDTLASSKQEPEKAGQAVKSLALGCVAAGGEAEEVVWLTARQAAGLRTVDVSIRVAAASSVANVEEMWVTASATLAIAVGVLFDAKAWTRLASKNGDKGRGIGALLDFDNDEEEVAERNEAVGVGLDVEMLGETAVEVTAIDLVKAHQKMETIVEEKQEQESALGEWLVRDRFCFFHTLRSPRIDADLAWRISWNRTHASPPSTNHTIIRLTPTPPPHCPTPAIPQPPTGVTLTLSYNPHQRLHQPFDLDVLITNHHPSRCFSTVLTLDSDEHFTLSATRRLSLPYMLPHQRKRLASFARLVPQSVGIFRLPNMGIRIVDPQNPSTTLALVHANEPARPNDRHGEAEDADPDADTDAWRDVVRIEYGAADGEKRLPKIVVSPEKTRRSERRDSLWPPWFCVSPSCEISMLLSILPPFPWPMCCASLLRCSWVRGLTMPVNLATCAAVFGLVRLRVYASESGRFDTNSIARLLFIGFDTLRFATDAW